MTRAQAITLAAFNAAFADAPPLPGESTPGQERQHAAAAGTNTEHEPHARWYGGPLSRHERYVRWYGETPLTAATPETDRRHREPPTAATADVGHDHARPNLPLPSTKGAVKEIAPVARNEPGPDIRPPSETKRPATDWSGLLAGCADPYECPDFFAGSMHIDAKHFPVPETDLFVRHEDGDGDAAAHAAYIQYRLRCLAARSRQYNCAGLGCPVEASGGVWCKRPLPLEVCRLNGDPWDDRLSNLRLLCPNCCRITSIAQRRGLPLPVSLSPNRLVATLRPAKPLPSIRIPPLNTTT